MKANSPLSVFKTEESLLVQENKELTRSIKQHFIDSTVELNPFCINLVFKIENPQTLIKVQSKSKISF